MDLIPKGYEVEQFVTDNERAEFSRGNMTLIDGPRETNDSKTDVPVDEPILRRLYSYMLKCRTVEERIRVLFRQSRFSGNYFSAVGQEAAEVGTTVDLLPEDTIAPSLLRHMPSKHAARFQTLHLFLWLFIFFNNLGSLLFAEI